jgi:catalase
VRYRAFTRYAHAARDRAIRHRPHQVPEELVPIRSRRPDGLERNPDNFFAETEQVAFCVARPRPRRRLSRPARQASFRFRNPRGNDHEVRGKVERFADHYTQATLFWNRQVDLGKQHIVNAFRFELSRVQTPAVRERMVSGLMNVAAELAETVAAGLGIRDMPAPMPKVLKRDVKPEVSVSPTLSLFARPGDGSNRTRRWQSSWRRGVTASRS